MTVTYIKQHWLNIVIRWRNDSVIHIHYTKHSVSCCFSYLDRQFDTLMCVHFQLNLSLPLPTGELERQKEPSKNQIIYDETLSQKFIYGKYAYKAYTLQQSTVFDTFQLHRRLHHTKYFPTRWKLVFIDKATNTSHKVTKFIVKKIFICCLNCHWFFIKFDKNSGLAPNLARFPGSVSHTNVNVSANNLCKTYAVFVFRRCVMFV